LTLRKTLEIAIDVHCPHRKNLLKYVCEAVLDWLFTLGLSPSRDESAGGFNYKCTADSNRAGGYFFMQATISIH